MKKQFRKIIAILCTIAMLLSLASAFAEEATAAPETETAPAATEIPSRETSSAQEASDDEETAPQQETPETDETASKQEAPEATEAPKTDAGSAEQGAGGEEASAAQDVPEAQDEPEGAASDNNDINNEEIPQDDEEESDSEEEDSDDDEDFGDDEEYEIIDSFGLVDEDVIDELTPDMTDEFKGFRYAQLSVGQVLEDTIEFDQEMVITLAPANGEDLLLKLYTTRGVAASMKVDSKAVRLTPAESDDASRDLFVYELAASASSHEIVLTSDDTLSFRLIAEKKASEETVAAAESEPAEEKTAVTADQPEEKEERVSDKVYDTLKVGDGITDTLAAGQKAVVQVKCGKNPFVTLTLKADSDLDVRADDSEVRFTKTADGAYTAQLENVAFRKFTITVTAAQEAKFTINAAVSAQPEEDAADEAEEEASEGLSDKAMLAKGYIKAFVAMDIGANVYATRDSKSAAGHLKAGTEVWVKLVDGADRAEIYNPDEAAFAQYINLVDVIATLKPEGTEALPTRELVLTSSLDGEEQVYYGTEVTLTAKLVNFLEDDVYSVQWMYTAPGGSGEPVEIEGADQLSFTYTLTEDNAKNIWTIFVTLTSGQA